MLKLSRDSDVDFDKYINRLSYLGYVYYNFDKIIYPKSRLELLKSSLSKYISNFLLESSGGRVIGIKRDSIIRYLLEIAKVPQSLLLEKKKDSYGHMKETYSINASHLQSVRDKGYAKELVEIYLKYTSLVSVIGLVDGIMKYKNDSNTLTNAKGDVLYGIGHTIKFSDNFRTYYSQFAHQQMPKDFLEALDAPSGYTMVKGDFAQSDLKIVYNMLLKDKSNVETMFRYEDSYEGMARLVEDNNFSLENFKESRDLYKQNTLSPIYGGTSASTEKAQKIIDNINKYLMDLPVYQEFKKRIAKKMDCGLPVILNTYFGNKIEVKDSFNNRKKIMDRALNIPAQAGTSEVVALCANSIMDTFEEHGITQENGGIYLYLNRHDELIFLIKNEYLEYSWIFQENEDIIIDGWMPLKIEFSFSDNYSVENLEVDRLCKSYYKELEPINIDKLIEDALESEYFIPCEDTKVYYIGTYSDDGRTSIAFMNEEMNVEFCREVNTENKDLILGAIIKIVGDEALNLKDNNCTSACIFTTLVMNEMSVSKGIPIIIKPNFSDGIYRSCINEAKLRFRRE